MLAKNVIETNGQKGLPFYGHVCLGAKIRAPQHYYREMNGSAKELHGAREGRYLQDLGLCIHPFWVEARKVPPLPSGLKYSQWSYLSGPNQCQIYISSSACWRGAYYKHDFNDNKLHLKGLEPTIKGHKPSLFQKLCCLPTQDVNKTHKQIELSDAEWLSNPQIEYDKVSIESNNAINLSTPLYQNKKKVWF